MADVWDAIVKAGSLDRVVVPLAMEVEPEVSEAQRM
jgi:hypothetical protein